MVDALAKQLDWRGMTEAGVALVVVVASVLVYGFTITKFTLLIEKLALQRREKPEAQPEPDEKDEP